MSNYVIPKGHQLRKRYTEEVLDRLKNMACISENLTATLEDLINQIENDNWEMVELRLRELRPALDRASMQSFTAANFAETLAERS